MTTDECIVPNYVAKDIDGYPRLKVEQRMWRMNRWMWTKVNGPIPSNMVVAHRCNNKGCINTNHMYLCSAHQNSSDAAKDNLYRTQENHFRAKVSNDDVIKMVALFNDGMTQVEISKLFNISQSQVSYCIRKRKEKLILCLV